MSICLTSTSTEYQWTKTQLLYHKPLSPITSSDPWFTSSPSPQNFMDNLVKKAAENAGIDKHLTNHMPVFGLLMQQQCFRLLSLKKYNCITYWLSITGFPSFVCMSA